MLKTSQPTVTPGIAAGVKKESTHSASVSRIWIAHVVEPGSRTFCRWVSTTYSAAMTAAWVRNQVFLDMVILKKRNWEQSTTTPNKKCAHSAHRKSLDLFTDRMVTNCPMNIS